MVLHYRKCLHAAGSQKYRVTYISIGRHALRIYVENVGFAVLAIV